MEPEPVEECVQSTLAALYPPFEATAPTLLSQVFEVLERTYQHDALRYTLDFLVPAKHILARVQSEACAQYSGFVFCHEGWPLCLREKILVQLGALPWQRLSPGDFYLQVVPHRECAPRLVVKCLSLEGRGVQELPVSPDSYSFLFTVEWLNGLNKERRVGRLERCLLAAGEKILSLPWPELVYPQFVHKDGFIVGQRCPADLAPEVLGARSPGDGRHSGGENRESEGEYVHLLEVSPTVHPASRIPESCGAQIQTMPTRKGHNKSRSRRHRAWLHHKSGCGENFALRKTCKAQEAERASKESSSQGTRLDQPRGDPCLASGQTAEVSQTIGSLSPGLLEQNQSPSGTETRLAIFGAAAAAAEDTGLGKAELLGPISQDPAHSREGSNENRSSASATPKRTAKGNRRKKKGAGRGAGGGRIRQGVDLASKEAGVFTDTKDPGKEEVCTDTGEQDSGNGEPSITTREQAVSTEECCVGITDCNGTREKSAITGEEGFGTSELAVGTGEYNVGTREPESGTEKCSIGTGDSSIGTRERSIGREGPCLSTEEETTAVGAGEPHDGTEEQGVGTPEQRVGTEGRCPGDKAIPDDTGEVTFTKLPGKNEPSVDGREKALSTAAEGGAEEPQGAALPAVAHPVQAVDWELLRSGVFALTGGLDRTGRSLLTVVPQPLRDELPPGQDNLVNTLRYLHLLLRQEQKALGLTVLLDLSQVDDWALQAPVLLPALRAFQETSPPPVTQLLVILPPDDRFVPHEEELVLEPAVEVRVLPLSELRHYVALDQLTPGLGGTLHHSPLKWVGAHQALEQLQALCSSVLQAVCEASTHLQAVGTAASQEEPSAQITLHQETMQKLLSEPQLLELQRCGGALLAQLPPLGAFSTEAVAATRLYQEVDEALHKLVQLSNRRLEVLQQEQQNMQAQWQTMEDKTCLESSGDSLGEKREEKRPAEGLAEGASLERTPLQSPKSQGSMQAMPESGSASRPRACSISTSSSPKHGWGLGARFGSSCSLTSLFQPHPNPKASPCCSPTRSNALDSSKKKQVPSTSPKMPLSPASHLALQALSDPGRPSVHIRGLEVSSRELADRSCSPREHVLLSRSGTHVAEAPWGATPRTERRRCLGVQQQLLAELLECEREYVGALAPPLSLSQEPGGQALPAELRCLGTALQATRDQLLAFHTSCFLGELEGCMNHPSRVGGCFLRHGEKFQLYATYAKDHHKFQGALTSLRAASKKGPVELRDDGQVARTLRVPLEQLERYQRFLGELLRECDLERGPDRQTLQEALQLLDTQEQRGRDLLAAEQIRGCEMKLSEQGPLLQRGELTVVCGRRKCQRHIFLFERLLLFTKCKGAEGGYVCKQALQTASMGLTQSVGPRGLRFELWFGRGPNRQAYTLQAASAEVKHQWTSVIAQLLWKQAAQPSVPMSISSCPTQHLAPLGLGPGHPSGLSLPGHVEEEEWDLDVKPIPRADTSDSEGPSPSHQEPSSWARGSLPGSSSALGHQQSSSSAAGEPVTPL